MLPFILDASGPAARANEPAKQDEAQLIGLRTGAEAKRYLLTKSEVSREQFQRWCGVVPNKKPAGDLAKGDHDDHEDQQQAVHEQTEGLEPVELLFHVCVGFR